METWSLIIAQSQEEGERLVEKVNNIRKARLLNLNVKNTKLMKISRYRPMHKIR